MASRDRLFCWNGLRRAQHDGPYDDQDRDINPSNVFVLNVASSIFAFDGHPEEGAKLADKSGPLSQYIRRANDEPGFYLHPAVRAEAVS